jgi:hypothetical protein
MADLTGMLQAAAGAAGGEIEPLGVDYDGSADYLSRATDLTGNSDGKTFTFSAWLYPTVQPSAGFFFDIADPVGGVSNPKRFYMRISSNQLLIQVATTPYETIVLTATSSASLPNDTFCNILVSCDMANAANRYIYINDVADSVTWTTYADLNIPFTGGAGGTRFGIGATAAGSANYKGRISGLYLDYTYRDLSIEANRRLFIDDDGLYVTPPTTGIISVPMDDPADPGRNDGTGGNFTLNGVVARSGRGPNQYNAVYSDFDGSNDFLSRTTNVTGIADSKLVTVHFIVKGDDFSLTPNIILFSDGAGAPKFYAVVTSAGKLQLVAWNAANSIILNAITTTTLYVGKNYSIEVSIDLSDTGKRYIYINGEAAGVTWTTYTDDSIDFTLASPRVRIGCDRNTTPSAFWNGSIGDVYFDTQYIDLSTSNPFFDTETDKPKFLGATGELPTGSAPLIYLPLYASSAGTNLGTGGDFTVNSGPYVGARGPSEFWADSAEFNGTTQGLRRNNTLTGASAGASGFSLVCSVNPADVLGNYFTILRSLDTGTSTVLDFSVFNNKMFGRTPFYSFCDTDNSSVTGLSGTWINVLFSVTKDGSWQYFINGIDKSEGAGTFSPVGDQDFTLIDDNYIGYNNSLDYGDGKLGFLWAANEYIDFSQEANRLKFFDAFNNPVDLGADGSVPTGSQPLIYMNEGFHLGTNLGSGGNFTPQNTPTDGGYVNG